MYLASDRGGTVADVDPMSIIAAEARDRRTVVLTAYEKDGSCETREVEPYSIRPGKEAPRLMFYCLEREALRSVLIHNIVSAVPTGNPFSPRWPVEL